tara:strand:- start:6239 stop:6394 length:156 start_codon:yes stop_codon:yes gene_type:complete
MIFPTLKDSVKMLIIGLYTPILKAISLSLMKRVPEKLMAGEVRLLNLVYDI